MGQSGAFKQMAEKQQSKYREEIIDNHLFYSLSQGRLPSADSSLSSKESEKYFTAKR
jgi:hypothetical protein